MCAEKQIQDTTVTCDAVTVQNPQTLSPYELAWQENTLHIADHLRFNLDTVAGHAFSAGLISQGTLKAITDRVKNKMNVPANVRARLIVSILLEKMNKKMGDAPDIMIFFIDEALDEHKQLQEYLS